MKEDIQALIDVINKIQKIDDLLMEMKVDILLIRLEYLIVKLGELKCK